MLKIEFKYLDDQAKMPQKQTQGSAGYDLFALHDVVLQPMSAALIPLGFSIALPNGYEAQIRPRSGLAMKHQVTVLNAPGTIDSDYHDQIQVLLMNFGKEDFHIQEHMRIAQLLVAKVESVEFVEVEVLSGSNRGGGWGSTGV